MTVRGQILDNVFSLATFCILMLSCYGKSTNCLRKSEGQEECSFLTLTCPSGHVIYDPVVIGDEDATCARYDVQKCKGMSPDLNVNILNCYWKNECNIFLPKRTMAFKFVNETIDCFNRPVKSVWVHGWKCVNETEIHDICNGALIDARMGTKGIIRSHANMPWNYKKSLFKSTQNGQCQTALGADLHDHSYINIALSVYSIDIDTTSELITVSYKSNGQPILKNLSREKYRYFKGDEKTGINIEFSSNNKYNETKAGSGFVLCYKYSKRGEQLHRNICDEIFTNNSGTPNCTVCRYEKTGKWTECSDETEAQLIANVTSKSHQSCEKTKVIKEKFCYCEYEESLTKCNLTTETYKQTKTLTDDSDAELCPKKVVTDFHCGCKYREEKPTKCDLTTKTYKQTRTLMKDSNAELCPKKVDDELDCECTYGNKTKCLKRGVLVTTLASGNPKKVCPKRKKVGKCSRPGSGKGRNINICNRSFSTIRKSSGLIRSHRIHPWTYGEKTIKCRKKIKIGKRQLKLSLTTVDIDEDVDEVEIKHIKRTIFRGNTRTKNFSITLTGGTVEIIMSFSRKTKSGKGFRIQFKKQRKGRTRRHRHHVD